MGRLRVAVIFVGVVMYAALALGAYSEGRAQTAQDAPHAAQNGIAPVSHLPALFEGQGALTLGCSLWDTPWIDTSAEAQDMPRRFVLLWMAPDPSGELTIHFSAKHPRGVVTIDGEQCGLSVNWAAFGEPQE